MKWLISCWHMKENKEEKREKKNPKYKKVKNEGILKVKTENATKKKRKRKAKREKRIEVQDTISNGLERNKGVQLVIREKGRWKGATEGVAVNQVARGCIVRREREGML